MKNARKRAQDQPAALHCPDVKKLVTVGANNAQNYA
jgi:hypothetical protein